MKTSFDLPEPLLRRAKAAAAQQGRPLRDLVAEAIDAKLAADGALSGTAKSTPAARGHGWKAFAAKLVQQADGTWVNPDGIDDERFFQALEDIRAENRLAPLRDPFADFMADDLVPTGAAPKKPPAAPEPAQPAVRRRKTAPAAARKSRPR